MSDDLEAQPQLRVKWRRCCSCCLLWLLGSLAALLFWLSGYDEPVAFAAERAKGIDHTPVRQLVPGPGLPDEVEVLDSVNNLDVVQFEGESFLAFRTAPHHFAGDDSRLVILRSTDRQTWTLEHEIRAKHDMREPRFLVFGGKLFFYYFKAGDDAFAFEPKHIQAIVREGPGSWSAPRDVYEQGYVVWRAKAYGDVAYMAVYYGARIYATLGKHAQVRLLRSTDGLDWQPVSEQPQLTGEGAEECAFEIRPDGGLLAVVRQEVKGSVVCTAEPGDLGTWKTVDSPHKYDSPIMFRRGARYFVIARRNVAGPFLRGPELLPTDLRRAVSLAAYSLTRKRTCLYEVDLEKLELVPLMDFPSRGDTAFAGLLPIDADRYFFVNYSSPIDGPDVVWFQGQLGQTRLYATELSFPPR